MAARKTSKSTKVVQSGITPLEITLILALTTFCVGFVAIILAV